MYVFTDYFQMHDISAETNSYHHCIYVLPVSFPFISVLYEKSVVTNGCLVWQKTQQYGLQKWLDVM